MASGIVYLVGAGPGDPGLLTLRGAECIRRADVVVYDRLAHPDLLRHARADAERIYVGKQAARHTLRQAEINNILIDRAQSGNIVCRLKGGDPYVFGRGGEEAESCRANGIRFEIVPGITSAIAAPSYAGIPVTHRDAASSFAVITGHERDDSRESGSREPGAAEQRRNWSHIANAADTLVFLMGVENIGEIASQLVANGRDPATPVAMIRWGTWPRQETLVSNLGEVEAEVQRRQFTAPAVTVVGEVVNLRESLRWFDTQPLFGKRVLVTRAREQASALSDMLREHGAEPVEFPVIRIVPNTDSAELDEALGRLPGFDRPGTSETYDWVVFTSANTVRVVADRLKELGADARAFGRARIASIGPATAEALLAIGIRPDFVPSRFVAEAVVEEWPEAEMSGKRVLLPRARDAREILPDRLREKGAAVDVITAYETLLDESRAEEIREQLSAGEIDAITFTSSSTVTNFVRAIGEGIAETALNRTVIACIGPITAATVRELGVEPTIVADEFTIAGLVEALSGKLGMQQ